MNISQRYNVTTNILIPLFLNIPMFDLCSNENGFINAYLYKNHVGYYLTLYFDNSKTMNNNCKKELTNDPLYTDNELVIQNHIIYTVYSFRIPTVFNSTIEKLLTNECNHTIRNSISYSEKMHIINYWNDDTFASLHSKLFNPEDSFVFDYKNRNSDELIMI